MMIFNPAIFFVILTSILCLGSNILIITAVKKNKFTFSKITNALIIVSSLMSILNLILSYISLNGYKYIIFISIPIAIFIVILFGIICICDDTKNFIKEKDTTYTNYIYLSDNHYISLEHGDLILNTKDLDKIHKTKLSTNDIFNIILEYSKQREKIIKDLKDITDDN